MGDVLRAFWKGLPYTVAIVLVVYAATCLLPAKVYFALLLLCVCILLSISIGFMLRR